MKFASVTVRRVTKLLETCLTSGIRLDFYEAAEKPPPTWDTVKEASLMAYTQALQDVLDAINGDSTSLLDATSDVGRLAFLEANDIDKFNEALGRMDSYGEELDLPD
ncbi:hypothetical protein ACFL2Q_19725 [Thermodesulfobacteriota bacterium]